jgi:hypothetical protein
VIPFPESPETAKDECIGKNRVTSDENKKKRKKDEGERE